MKTINEQFLEKAKSQGNCIQHDFADELDYHFITEILGGEENLKQNYPQLYEVIHFTRSQSLMNHSRNSALKSESNQKKGFEGSAKIRYINYNPQTILSTASSLHLTQKVPSLAIIGQLKDLTNDKYIDGFSVFDNEKSFLEAQAAYSSERLIQSDDREFQAISTFTWIEYDDTNTPLFKAYTEISDVLKVLGSSNIVKELKVDDPDTIKNPERKHTVIVYDRQSQVGEDFDYEYSLVKVGNEIKVKAPFKGSVELNFPFVPKYVDKNINFKLQLEHPEFGIIPFNTDNWSLITWKQVGNKLCWEFPEDWGITLDKKDFTYGLGFSLYCQMNIVAEYNGVVFPIPIPIVISADEKENGDPSYKHIKPIDIWWGCLAKDTRILMADGSEREIQNIRPGDRVMSENRQAGRVTDVIKGQEEKMVRIVSMGGKVILATEDHPILTARGMVMARQLNAADILCMIDGQEEIRFVYPQEYKDTVYSLMLEEESNLIANHFIVGDFKTQQTMYRPNKRGANMEKFQREFLVLMESLNAKKNRNE